MTHDDIDRTRIGQHPMMYRFLWGVFNSRPPAPRYRSTSNTDVVLKHLESASDNQDPSTDSRSGNASRIGWRRQVFWPCRTGRQQWNRHSTVCHHCSNKDLAEWPSVRSILSGLPGQLSSLSGPAGPVGVRRQNSLSKVTHQWTESTDYCCVRCGAWLRRDAMK